jgi:putative flippase GtrA
MKVRLPEYLARLLRRFFQPEFLKFVGYGVVSYALAAGSTTLLVKGLHLDRRLAYAIAQVAVLCVNFFVSKYFIFEPSRRRNPFVQFLLFVAVNAGFRLADWGIFSLLSLAIESIPVAVFISASSVLPFKFLFMRKGVF